MAVIGTNIDGTREVIKHGENGIICGTNPESLREAIITVMEDEQMRVQLGKNARMTVNRNYSLQKLICEEFQLYYRLLYEQ